VGSNEKSGSGWIEPVEERQLRATLFDETAELLVKDHPVLGSDMRFETGIIEVLLEDEELTRVVAFGVDGEFGISGSWCTFWARSEISV